MHVSQKSLHLTRAGALALVALSKPERLNFGFPNTDVFHYIAPYSAAPNTIPPQQNVTDVDAVRENGRLIFISCGSDDGLINNSENYHNFLDDNGVEHIWQIERGQGHTKTVWNRSLHNFAQRVFQDLGAAPEVPVDDGMGEPDRHHRYRRDARSGSG